MLYRKFHHLLVYHFQSRSAIARGDMESARSSSSTARQLSNISVIACVASLLVGMLIAGLYLFIGVIPNMSSGPSEYLDWSVPYWKYVGKPDNAKNDSLSNRLCLTFILYLFMFLLLEILHYGHISLVCLSVYTQLIFT